MNYLKALTAKKCLLMWLISFICLMVMDEVYLFWNADEYTPAAFDALEMKPGFLAILLLYYILFALPLSITASVLSSRDKKPALSCVSVGLTLLSLVGFVSTLFYFIQGIV